MKLTNLNKREEMLMYVIISMISGILFYRFMISPELRRVHDASSSLHQQENLLKTRTDELQRRKALDEKIEQLKAKTAGMEILLFYKHEIPDFLRFITGLIRDTGNVMMTMRPGDVKSPSQATTTEQKDQKSNEGLQTQATTKASCLIEPVEISLRGNYKNVKRFFERLGTHRKLVTLGGLSIITKDPEEVNTNFTLNMYIYENETQK